MKPSGLLLGFFKFLPSSAVSRESRSAVPDSWQPHSPWNSPDQNTGVGSLSLLQGIFPGIPGIPGIKPRSPALQANSLPAEPQGKPKNTGVSSLSLLQWIFPTQESNQGLLHCRWILYQLSYQFSSVRWNLSETCYGQEALPTNLLEDEAL